MASSVISAKGFRETADTVHVRAHGSKSDSNRALILAAIARGTSVLRNASPSDDTENLADALRLLGVGIRRIGRDMEVSGGSLHPYIGDLSVGEGGTTFRFLLPFLAGIEGAEVSLIGQRSLIERPLEELLDALRQISAEVQPLKENDSSLIRIRGKRLLGGEVRFKEEAPSTQFISALLLSAALFRNGIKIVTPQLTRSRGYVEMTRDALRAFGVPIEIYNYQVFEVPGGATARSCEYFVAGDASSASYLFGLAALSGRSVTVSGLDRDSKQGDSKFPEILERMGCFVSYGADWVTVRGKGSLQPISIDMSDMPDSAVTLAVVASCAQGTSTISGLSSLRVKESDRLNALVNNFDKVGIAASVSGDTLTVIGGPLRGARIDSFGDHRIVMAFSLLGVRVDGLEISDPSVVRKSYPGFWSDLEHAGVKLERSGE